MSQTLSVSDATMGKYVLSITTRSCGDSPQVMEDLTYKTIKAWLWIANELEHGEYTLPVDAETGDLIGSVEDRYTVAMWETNEEFKLADAWGDSRVTVWDTFKSQSRIGFHLNSDDIPQVAVDTWLANHKAIERVLADTPQTAPQSRQDAHSSASNVIQDDKPAQPKNAPQTPASGIFYTKNEAIEKLKPGDKFAMKICQIACVSDKKGNRQYEFSAKYGQNVGKFPEITIYADNEVAQKNGLIAYLETFNLKLGESKMGEWILHCNVGAPKEKDGKTYGRVYAESFEGQTQSV